MSKQSNHKYRHFFRKTQILRLLFPVFILDFSFDSYCNNINVCFAFHLPRSSSIFARALPRKPFIDNFSIILDDSLTENSESSEVSEQIAEGDHHSATLKLEGISKCELHEVQRTVPMALKLPSNPTMMPSGEWWGEETAKGNCSSTRNTIFSTSPRQARLFEAF